MSRRVPPISCEKQAVLRGEPGLGALALKDHELVPQAQNLDLLLAHVHRQHTHEGEGVRHDKIGHAQQHG
jgi:hypothetical protein